jgi:hypothetical protein
MNHILADEVLGNVHAIPATEIGAIFWINVWVKRGWIPLEERANGSIISGCVRHPETNTGEAFDFK